MPEINKDLPNMTTPAGAKKKASLGRGLGSLLSGSMAAPAPEALPAPVPVSIQTTQAEPKIADEAKIWILPIDRLVANTQQPRQTFAPEPLRDLAASIKEKGILQPITARRIGERQFEIIAGERRWRAAQLAGLHEVPVILKKVSQQDSLEYAIIENIQREDLNPMEEAEAYQLLSIDYDLTQQQVADKLGKERSSVANSLRLLALPAEVKTLVRKNQLSAGHAKVLLSLEAPDKQILLAQQILKEKLSVRATERAAEKLKNEQTRKNGTGDNQPGSTLDLNVSQRLAQGLAAELQKLIGTKVSIEYADHKGRVQIQFYSDDQLTDIVEKIRKSWQN